MLLTWHHFFPFILYIFSFFSFFFFHIIFSLGHTRADLIILLRNSLPFLSKSFYFHICVHSFCQFQINKRIFINITGFLYHSIQTWSLNNYSMFGNISYEPSGCIDLFLDCLLLPFQPQIIPNLPTIFLLPSLFLYLEFKHPFFCFGLFSNYLSSPMLMQLGYI